MPHDATYDIGHAEPILPKVQLSSFPSCFPLPATYAILMGDTATCGSFRGMGTGWVGNQVALFALLPRSLAQTSAPSFLRIPPQIGMDTFLPSSVPRSDSE